MKRPWYIPLIGLGVVSAALAAFEIPWQTLDGGGGVSSSVIGANTWKVTGTIGQFDAHAASSVATGFSVSDGYWAAVIPTEGGGPVLTITRAGAQATLSWGADAAGYQLFQSPNLQNWTPNGGILNSAGSITVTPSPANPKYFFRLQK